MGTPTSGPLAGVRDAAKAVAGRARLVRVNEAQVADYAASLPLEQALRPQHDAAARAAKGVRLGDEAMIVLPAARHDSPPVDGSSILAERTGMESAFG